MGGPSPEPILQAATGFMVSKHLFVASEVGLFTALAGGPLPLRELAEATGLPPRTARIVADAVCALGFLEQKDGLYANGEAAQAFLSGAGPADLRPLLRFWNAISYPAWTGLEHSVRTGERVRPELTPELQRVFSEGVAAFTAPVAAALAARADVAGRRRVVDVGGGTGSFLVALLEQHEHLEGTLFDLPEVVELARSALEASPLRRRLAFVGGDIVRDPLPEGHDVVLLANLLHYFDEDGCRALLGRLRSRVSPGASILLVDFWTDPSRTRPLVAALMGGEFLALQGGDVFSEEQARAWLAETGWRWTETAPLDGPLSLVAGEAV